MNDPVVDVATRIQRTLEDFHGAHHRRLERLSCGDLAGVAAESERERAALYEHAEAVRRYSERLARSGC
jgi:hypothetical protein